MAIGNLEIAAPIILATSKKYKIAATISCKNEEFRKKAQWLEDLVSQVITGERDIWSIPGDRRILVLAVLYGGVILFDTRIPNDPIPLSRLHIRGSYRLEKVKKGRGRMLVFTDDELLSLWRTLFKTNTLPSEVALVYPEDVVVYFSEEGECIVPPVGFSAFIK